tara:strand:+ start:1189 stop:1755 length:567 start_codon:yes stop_codon:yes gene_type:complete
MKTSKNEAENAVKTLLKYVGENPEREGLLQTPKRFVKALDEWFAGYKENPVDILSTTFSEVENYDQIIILKDIDFESHCEHHLCPIIGKATVAYLPNSRVVGISKLARVVNAYSKRYQIQEKMTEQIAKAIDTCLNPRGVAVIVDAKHFCIGTRGIHKPNSSMVTSSMKGVFMEDHSARLELMQLIRG